MIIKKNLFENRDNLFELVRFRTNKTENWVSLQDYVDKMQKDQKSIFYIIGENFDSIKVNVSEEDFFIEGICVGVIKRF